MIIRRFARIASVKRYYEKPKSEPETKAPVPRQHPIKMNETLHEVISYKIKNRPMTPLQEVPQEAKITLFPYEEQPQYPRATHVILLGMANAGKSSLLNALIGNKIAPISPKYYTSRENKIGLKTTGSYQLAVTDTPGAYQTDVLGESINTSGWNAIAENDVSCFVIDAVKSVEDDLRSTLRRL